MIPEIMRPTIKRSSSTRKNFAENLIDNSSLNQELILVISARILAVNKEMKPENSGKRTSRQLLII
jgi:hypothetical protein